MAQSAKTEMRGVWVATLLNIDWPSQGGLSTKQQKQEIIDILEEHQSQGINAVFLQVRPAADAFYNSPYEPWSQWLTGAQATEPRPYYDPLNFWIEECHRRGMELHAWFNPFRAALHEDFSVLPGDHVIREKPHWFVTYGGRTYFDPGIPEARHYIASIILDVARRYDIDGIHFDDYFYPYKVKQQEFPDSLSYNKYGQEFKDKASWRRNNVTDFVRAISDSLHQIKPWLRFGISPFGVWRNRESDPAGSATRAGQTNYDHLYADVLLWMKEGWIDYLAPQIYWHIGFDPADYRILLDWWSRHSYGRHIYIGQSAYKVQEDADFEAWRNPSEIPSHLRLNQQYPQIKGNIYFSSRSLRSNVLGVGDSLRTNHYRHRAMVPPMSYKPAISLGPPSLYRISHGHKDLTIYWSLAKHDPGDCRYQVVYRFDGEDNLGVNDPSHIVAFLPAGVNTFIDTPPKKGHYTYVVTSVSKTNHESAESLSLTINYRKRKPKRRRAKS